MDNIDKMVIDDMIKTTKEQLYISSPIICFFLILAGAVFDSTFLMLLGLIVILVFIVSLAVKKIQKEYDKRVNDYLELMENADKVNKALTDKKYQLYRHTYNNGDIDISIYDEEEHTRRVIYINNKYVDKFNDYIGGAV